jgi:dipeptidyl aminopeptidase/acylaminoacyl peptidase
VSGHNPDKDRAWFTSYEPLLNVTSAYPPTFLLHGEKDKDVPFEQSVLMAEALRRKGVDYNFISNPDWGHSFDRAGMKDPMVKDAFGRILTFLEKHVR